MAETESDWQELFETYRYEVIRAGFGAWDEAAFADDTPNETERRRTADIFDFRSDGDGGVSARFERYATAFVQMVACLERGTVERLVGELGERVRTRDGGTVTAVFVRSDEMDDEVLGDRYAYEGIVEIFSELNETLFAPDGPEPQAADFYGILMEHQPL